MSFLARLAGFAALMYLSMLAGLFIVEGYPIENKWQWVRVITASIILAAFVILA